MSYAERESSIQDGAPVFLYLFVQGPQSWRYTSAPAVVTWSGEQWAPSAVSHSNVTQSSELAKNGVSLRFALSCDNASEFAKQFLGYTPEAATSVTLYHGHPEDDEFVVFWRGRVSGGKASGATISVDCESILTSMRRPGLRPRYQKTCRRVLYSDDCGVVPASHGASATAVAVSGRVVLVPEAASYPTAGLRGGMLQSADGALRMIAAHDGTRVTLSLPIESMAQEVALSGSTPITIYPGCDHSTGPGGCEKFHNVINYGGFPWIPQRNPFDGNSIV